MLKKSSHKFLADSGKKANTNPPKDQKEAVSRPNAMNWCGTLLIAASYFLLEGFAFTQLHPDDWLGLAFGGAWALLLTAIVVCLPRKAGRIVYGVSYYLLFGWTMAQSGYYRVFQKMMWLTDIFFADEGAVFIGDVISHFGVTWWVGGIMLIIVGVMVLMLFPMWKKRLTTCLVCSGTACAALVTLFLLPQAVYSRDEGVWGTRSEYGQSSSRRAGYNIMYSARNVYDICGMYQLTFRDFWKHTIYPMTPGYRAEQKANIQIVNDYFTKRGEPQDNDMTGIFAGKNVVLVLMESMDDWMITPEDTPTITRMMDEGIQFNNFYTPFYGSARTLNTEFCSNSGIFLPTNGNYVFNYVTNHFNESMASQFVDNGYTAEVFHYNNPSFYSRGVFEPAMGYNAYNTFEDYTSEKNDLYSDTYLFDNPQINDLFFREGPTFNFIITRSAHLSYVYNEVLSAYALRQYPEYRGKFGHEEVDCARVKAKLVDDMFARLLQELEAHGQLDNTVIVGITDHYTYGFKDIDKMLELSGVPNTFLLEKTPCFIWSADSPDVDVEKTLNTSDLLPTVLNLTGIDSPYRYLGQDAFDPNYPGYALFSDGSWIADGIYWQPDFGNQMWKIRDDAVLPPKEKIEQMAELGAEYRHVSNLLLITDYYAKVQ